MTTRAVAPDQFSGLRFRPDIQGLRAVAVGLVVALHAGVTSLSGGYIGVDVFFVISGFLITSLLLDEVRSSGRVAILGFYARRARRILPVACFVIATTTIVAYLQLGPLAGRTTAIDGQWATGFAANFRFIGQGTNYFASGLPPSPLQHYWSLAVEEQFYLVWPTLLFGLVFIGSRFAGSSATVRLGLAALVAASLYWSIHLSASEPTSAYFSPLTRAWELGVGALIASFTVAISRIPSWLRSAASWIGLSLIAVAAFALSATTEFPGYAALLPVFGAALVIAGGIGAPPRGATRMLGLKPLQWLGLVSFSLYLWHWPVFVIAEERSATPLSTAARVVCVLITLVLSAATYYLIEHPLRTSKLLRPTRGRNVWERSGKALLAGAVAILVALGASAYTNSRAASAINNASRRRSSGHGLTSTLTTTAQLTADEQTASLQGRVRVLVRRGLALHTVPADVDPPVLTLQLIPKHLACLQGLNEVTVRTCTFGAAKSRRTLVVFGDSHATTWMAALDLYGKQTDYRVVTLYKEACPVPSVNAVSRDGPNLACTTWRARAIRYIRSLHPAGIIFAFGQEGRPVFTLEPWFAGLRTTLESLVDTGAPIVEIGNNASLPEDPGLCLSRRDVDPASCTGKFLYREQVDGERAVLREYGGSLIDVEPWYCLHGRCPAIIDHRIAYTDQSHLSPQYVSDLEPLLAASLRSVGLR